MSAAWSFIAGWLCGSLFCLVGIWVGYRRDMDDSEAFHTTGDYLADYEHGHR